VPEYVDKLRTGARACAVPSARAALGGLRKRAFDVIVASVILVSLTPSLLATVVLIRLLIGKSVILAQERIGFRGRAFASYRFRTAIGDDESRTEGLGGVLRASGLDQLPQLFNVLIGNMSLIGPRPIMAGEFSRYFERVPEYFGARPGLIGLWWHADMRSFRRTTRHIALDRYYVRHWSMRLDLALLIKAISAID
jgi:exopolysaccharide production protein ExoY